MRIKTIKTRLVHPPQDDLFDVINQAIKKIPERSVLVIASKIVSLHQGRCVLKSDYPDKDVLIKKEADKYLPRHQIPKGYVMLTVKDGIIIPTAGIDASNSGDYYILWPKNSMAVAKQIYQFIRKKYKKKKIGVIIADSHTVPMRRGVMGVALGYYGLKPVNDYRGRRDLFSRKLKISSANVVDSLATAAVLEMGESDERTPLALITEVPFVEFSTGLPDKKYSKLKIGWNEDIYGPLLKSIKWKSK